MPGLFRTLAMVYAVMHVVGLIVIVDPPGTVSERVTVGMGRSTVAVIAIQGEFTTMSEKGCGEKNVRDVARISSP